MAIEPVVYRVTDARYLNELLFRMEMRMVGSDAVWKKVLQYRASHRLSLAPLETLLRAPCYFTLTEAIAQKVEQGERTLRRLAESLETGSEELRRHALQRSLSAVNDLEECEMSPLTVKSVLNGTYRGNEDFHEPLLRYHAYLRELFSSRGEESLPDEDFLAAAAVKCPGDRDRDPKRIFYNPFAAISFLTDTGVRAMKLAGEYLRFAEEISARYYDPRRDAYIKNVGVAPEARGQGRLHRITDELCGDLPVYLETHDENNVAIYEHMGFKVCEAADFHGYTHYAMYRG